MTDQPTTPTDTTAADATDAPAARRPRRRAASRPAGPPTAGSADAGEGTATSPADTAAGQLADTTADAPAAAPADAAADAAPAVKKTARKRAPRKKAAAAAPTAAEATASAEGQAPEPGGDADPAASVEAAAPAKKATRKRAPRKKAVAAQPAPSEAAEAPAEAAVEAPATSAVASAAAEETASATAGEAAPVDAALVAPMDVAPAVPDLPGAAPDQPTPEQTAPVADAAPVAEAPTPAAGGTQSLVEPPVHATGEPVTAAPSAEEEPAAEAAEGETAEDETAEDETTEVESEEAETTRAQAAQAETAETEPAVAAPAPAVPLLFQAPEPPAPRRRRRAQAPAGPPVHHEEPVTEDRVTADAAGPQPAEDRAAVEEPAPTEEREPASAQAEEETGTGGRRRRRRGGRGRRARAEDAEERAEEAEERADVEEGAEAGAAEETAADESDTAEEAEPDTEGAEAEDEESGSASSRRRRRRRRRAGGGNGEEAATEDPPGTVTKVRQPRRVSESRDDEVASVKGSTRLEAKKQRRRDGREAGRRKPIITESEFLARRESVERTMIVRERAGRTQIAVLEDDVLVEHYVANETNASMIGNVFLGRVQNVLPSMEAAFIDIGKGRNAVLYAGEVNWDAAGLEGGPRRIEAALKSGDSVLVQVTKDPMGHKGARLTSQISLPGRYLVYVPNSSMTGISRKLPDTERSRLKKILKAVVPEDAGVIVRTAAEGASEEELQRDVERLAAQWEDIQRRASSTSGGSAPKLLHGEPDLTVRVVRDVFNEDFSRLLVSGGQAWEVVQPYVSSVAPDLADRVSRWTSEEDVFTAHRVDEQLTKAMDRKVWLPSGGSLVIDRTEAMTVVDVNTGKFTGAGGNLEETVTRNNLEAAEEVVRQLRLRDIGGIIVVDFIDMVLESNRDLVLRRLVECLGRDRTKHQVAEVTSLGLVQMTRKRVGQGLLEVFSEPCEHCHGRGVVVHAEPVSRSGGNGVGGGSGNGSGKGAAGGAAEGGNGSGGRGSESGRSRGKGRGKSGAPVTPPPAPAPRKPIPAGLVASLAHHSEPLAHPDDPDAAPPAPAQPEAEAVPEAVQPETEAVPEAVRPETDAVPEAVQPEVEPQEVRPEAVQPETEAVPEAVQPEAEPQEMQPEAVQPETEAVQPEPVQPEPVVVDAGPAAPGGVEPAPDAPRRRRRRASAPSGPPPGAAPAVLTADQPASTPAHAEVSPS